MNLPDLARMNANLYEGELAILYDRVLRYRSVTKDKNDTLWNFDQRARPEYDGGPHTLRGRATTFCSRYRGLPQPETDKGGGNHRGSPELTLFSGLEAPSNVGRGEEILRRRQ